MKHHNDIIEELKQWGSPLADMSRAMPYYVPTAYFETATHTFVKGVHAANAADPAMGYSKYMPHTVPFGYFSEFPGQIYNAAMSTDEFPADLNVGHPYSVPANYFDELPGNILAKIQATEKQDASQHIKTISLTRKSAWYNMRWAAAAVLLISISLGSYKMLIAPQYNIEHQLASVPLSALDEYASMHTDDADGTAVLSNGQAVNLQLNEEEIIHYLNEKGINENELN
ncbi:MAG: hypothetical protein WCG87_10890 [Bacteroidota bacterium]